MKKYIFCFILILFSGSLFSQKFSFSIVADPQVTWLRTELEEVKNDGAVFGINGGVVFDRYFTDNYAFSTGISLWQTGGKLLFTQGEDIHTRSGVETVDTNSSVTYRLQYLTIPFSLKLCSNEIGYISFFAHVGINNHISVGKSAYVPSTDNIRVGIPDEINIYSMSYFFGGGCQYSLGGNTALLGGLYFTSGFWDIMSSDNYRATLNAVSLRLGIRF
jgi:hypothetical protein